MIVTVTVACPVASDLGSMGTIVIAAIELDCVLLEAGEALGGFSRLDVNEFAMMGNWEG